jgi:hypothetical protein
MSSYTIVRPRAIVLGLVSSLLVSLFLFRYGTSLRTRPPTSATQLPSDGWRRVDGLAISAEGFDLAGLGSSPDGIPATGVFLVNLWDSVCGPCRHEMPWLQRLYATGSVNVIGVTRDHRASDALEQLCRARATYPNVWDTDANFWSSLGRAVPPNAAPSSLIVDDGRVTWAYVGPFGSYEQLRESVVERLGKHASRGPGRVPETTIRRKLFRNSGCGE